MKITRALLLTLVAALLAACSAQLQPEDQKVRRIAVVQPPEPERYSADVSHPSGVLGRVVDQMRGVSNDGEKFTAGLKKQGFAIASRLAERSAQALRSRGYEVTLVRDGYKVRDGITLLDVDKSKYEALLTFDIDTVGFLAPRNDAPLQPALAVAVTLAPTATLEFVPFYKQSFIYGWEGHMGTWTHLAAPSQRTYRSADELIGRQAEAGQTLYAGADLIAERIAQDLAPKR
jgi:hypothetical protein